MSIFYSCSQCVFYTNIHHTNGLENKNSSLNILLKTITEKIVSVLFISLFYLNFSVIDENKIVIESVRLSDFPRGCISLHFH